MRVKVDGAHYPKNRVRSPFGIILAKPKRMSGGKKQQKNRRDSVKNWRFQVLPPERSLRQLTTSVNEVWRLLPLRVVYPLRFSFVRVICAFFHPGRFYRGVPDDSAGQRMGNSLLRFKPADDNGRSFPGHTECSKSSIARYVRGQALGEEFTE